MKIYIIGTVGSGKSTLSQKMAEILQLPVYHLDEVVHFKDHTAKFGNSKRSDVEIERIFSGILDRRKFYHRRYIAREIYTSFTAS